MPCQNFRLSTMSTSCHDVMTAQRGRLAARQPAVVAAAVAVPARASPLPPLASWPHGSCTCSAATEQLALDHGRRGFQTETLLPTAASTGMQAYSSAHLKVQQCLLLHLKLRCELLQDLHTSFVFLMLQPLENKLPHFLHTACCTMC